MLQNLKKLRQQYGISQQRLANAIGVSQPSINKYENHNIEPDIGILIKMADYFNTSIDYIVGRTEEQGKMARQEPFYLSKEEKETVMGYRSLSPEEKVCVRLVMQTILKK